MIAADASLEEVADLFKGDRFAYEAAGCRVVAAAQGTATCEMPLDTQHYNAMHNVMGGAIFTLADYALAIACNVGYDPTVSIASTIEFFKASKGTKLIAKATEDRSGASIAFYTIDVVDDLDTPIARMVSTVKRLRPAT